MGKLPHQYVKMLEAWEMRDINEYIEEAASRGYTVKSISTSVTGDTIKGFILFEKVE